MKPQNLIKQNTQKRINKTLKREIERVRVAVNEAVNSLKKHPTKL